MNFIGYLVTLANLHNFAGNSPNDMTIRVGSLQSITNEVQNLPGFSADGFRETGYQRNGRIGVYLSKNVQNYLFYNQANPDDEGLMLTLFFPDAEDSKENTDVVDNGPTTLFLHKNKVPEDVQKVVNLYAKTRV